MKYIIIFIVGLWGMEASAQWTQPNNSYGIIQNGIDLKRFFAFPTGCGAPSLPVSADSARKRTALYGDSCNNKLYFYNPSVGAWSEVGSSSGLDSTTVVSLIDSLAIPLAGTSVDKPVTGDVELSNNDDPVHLYSGSLITGYGQGIRTWRDDATFEIFKKFDGADIGNVQFSERGINISTPDPAFDSGIKGLSGSQDFTANIGPLDYTQKKYVDDSLANTIDSLIAGANTSIDYTNRRRPVVSSTGGGGDTASLSTRINNNYFDVAGVTSGFELIKPNGLRDTIIIGSGGSVTDFSAGNLSPLFTTGVATSTSTPALSFTQSNVNQFEILGRKASGSGAYSFLTADSSLIPDLHSEGYYNTKYGSGGLSDTTFLKIQANALGTTTTPTKGLLLKNATLSGAQYSPAVVFQGYNGTTRNFWKAQGQGNNFTIALSSDSSVYGTAQMSIGNTGGLTMVGAGASTFGGPLTSSSFMSAASYGGSNLSISAFGFMNLGTNASANNLSTIDITRASGGLLNARGTTSFKRNHTARILTGTITNAGSGYTNGSHAITFTGSATGTGGTATATVSGNVVTAVTLINAGGGYKVGDVLTASIPGGSGFVYTVASIPGGVVATNGLSLTDTTIGTQAYWNNWAQAWQNDYYSTSAATESLSFGADYIFTGTTTTYTLPAPLTNVLGRSNMIIIKNQGVGAITVNSHSGNTIYTTVATNTIVIAAGAACALLPSANYFNVLYNN